jgi:ankyrin repeat protein
MSLKGSLLLFKLPREGQKGVKMNLFTLIKKEKENNIKELLERGVNPNVQDKEGYTPLCLSLKLKQIDIPIIFLKYGADPRIENQYGEDAYILAARHLNYSVLQKLQINNRHDVNRVINEIIKNGASHEEDALRCLEIFSWFGFLNQIQINKINLIKSIVNIRQTLIWS